MQIREEDMIAATALGACGIAFFYAPFVQPPREASKSVFTQALPHSWFAAGKHPEQEIDKVTTPRGSTIEGRNQMEHEGYSSAMIKSITISAKKAACLYVPE